MLGSHLGWSESRPPSGGTRQASALEQHLQAQRSVLAQRRTQEAQALAVRKARASDGDWEDGVPRQR